MKDKLKRSKRVSSPSSKMPMPIVSADDPRRTRDFDGKQYGLWNLAPLTEESAKIEARRIWNQNQLVQTVKMGTGYFIYVGESMATFGPKSSPITKQCSKVLSRKSPRITPKRPRLKR